ncbi:transcriptional regulator-like protein [Vibrio ichthyoenteri ATCC 700023]|uniref:Transcriptional regulator-like protein n=1 Tax=Vibrio ichthyoenteri ATCC 700023 TaxID=870968 RepID=F9RZF1_9VIBR|nr:transcriptional regulator-like protein [Vibrio ichthyoenteri ATCC 700023]
MLSTSSGEKSQLRTVQRCINKVVEDNASIETQDEYRPYRYQIAQGHRHPIKPDGMSSVVSLQVIEKEIRSMLPPTLRSDVDAIFSSLKQEDTKQTKLWSERFCYFQQELPLEAPDVGNEFFKQIEQALLNKKDIEFSYQKRGATEPKAYKLTPLGLFLHGNSFYLIGMKPNQPTDIRTYALHRVHTLKIGFSSNNILAKFNVKEYVEKNARHFSGGEMQTVILRIDNLNGLHLIEETRLSPNQKIIALDENYTTVETEVRDSLTFEWWLMKNANIVEVISPLPLRNKIIRTLHASLRLYGQNWS